MNIKEDSFFFLIFFVFVLIAILIGTLWAIATEKRLKRFFLGKKARDLEDAIINLENDIADLKSAKEDIKSDIAEIDIKIRKSVRGLKTLRFNPFSDQGSNQSFAIGMLNEEGDGVVFSSLYSRERMSIFAKPIKNGKSEYELSDEERQVLEQAKVK